MPPRVLGKIRTKPRVWDTVESSVEMRLEDQLWLVRDVASGSFEEGTPISAEQEYGPYAADLSTADGDETRTDHFHAETTHTAIVQIDEEPRISDRVRVRRRGRREERFRVVGRVRERRPEWGGVFVWHLELARTVEW